MPWKHHILYFPTHSGHFATTKGKIKRDEYKSPPTPSIFPLLTVTTSQLPLPMLQINTHHLTQPYKDPLAVPITPGNHSHWNLLIRQLTKRHLALNIRLKSKRKTVLIFYGRLIWKTPLRQPGDSQCRTLSLTAVERRAEKRHSHVHLEEPFLKGVFEVWWKLGTCVVA